MPRVFFSSRKLEKASYDSSDFPGPPLHLVDDIGLDEVAYEWQAIDRVMGKAKRNIRPLLGSIALEGTPANRVLLEAFHTMSQAFRDGLLLPLADLPMTLIPQRSARYLTGADGTILLRSFEDDLVDDEIYDQRHTLLPQLGLANAGTPIRSRHPHQSMRATQPSISA